MSPLAVVCVLTFLHYVGAQMRGPVLPLYAAAHGATATSVGVIVAAHMMIAAVASIPLGRASDVWGRGPLLLAGMIVSAVTSALLPLAETAIPLSILYGAAGAGVAAFTPSALSLVGDAAASGAAGRAFAWYTIAHYGAIGIGSFLGGVVAQAAGYRATFIASAGLVMVTFVLGLVWIERSPPRVRSDDTRASFADVRMNPIVWAGWIISFCGLVTQAVVYTFFPLLADERGVTSAGIAVVFLVLGLANTWCDRPTSPPGYGPQSWMRRVGARSWPRPSRGSGRACRSSTRRSTARRRRHWECRCPTSSPAFRSFWALST
jgi:MFS family permease